MSTIESMILAVLGLLLVGGVAGGAAGFRLLQRNVLPPPKPRKGTPPEPTFAEQQAAQAEAAATDAAVDRRAATRDEIAAVQAIPNADARSAALADLVRRRRGGR